MEQNQDLARALGRLTVAWGNVQLHGWQSAAHLVGDCIGGANVFAERMANVITAERRKAALSKQAFRQTRDEYAARLLALHRGSRLWKVQQGGVWIGERRPDVREFNAACREMAGAKPQQVAPLPMLSLEDAKRIVRVWFGVEAEKETVAEDAHSRQRRRWEAAVAHCDRTQQAHPRFAITMGKRQFKTFRGIGDLASAEGVTRQAFTDDLRAYAERQSGR